jgi:hypothetical protein
LFILEINIEKEFKKLCNSYFYFAGVGELTVGVAEVPWLGKSATFIEVFMLLLNIGLITEIRTRATIAMIISI